MDALVEADRKQMVHADEVTGEKARRSIVHICSVGAARVVEWQSYDAALRCRKHDKKQQKSPTDGWISSKGCIASPENDDSRRG